MSKTRGPTFLVERPNRWQELMESAGFFLEEFRSELRLRGLRSRDVYRRPREVLAALKSALDARFDTVPDRELRPNRKSRWLSALSHVLAISLVVGGGMFVKGGDEEVEIAVVELTPIEDVGDYKLTLPPSTKKAGGGGGGGERNPLPASKGRLPKFSLRAPLTPPAAVIRNPNPKLTAEPTVVIPPDIKIDSPKMPEHGDPLSSSRIPSGGPGSGSGIGTGSGGGVGEGFGPGVGPGWGGGTGGQAFRIGGSVSAPSCIHCPDPEYSEEARKARHQGVVVLWAVVDEDGRAQQIRVQKSLGLGLDEAALRAVQNWRFRPAQRFGKPVPVYMAIEVNFHLY